MYWYNHIVMSTMMIQIWLEIILQSVINASRWWQGCASAVSINKIYCHQIIRRADLKN